ncbi:hypothetical protein NLN94_23610, partial [Citrobacter portucalensis]|uniref:hypothetical protein n=1 Tax=Citrobacter portucalensis TaxID=1639133 RepID=UPI00226B028A
IIYVHNGFRLGSQNKILTAFGSVDVNNGETPAEFCERVNKLDSIWLDQSALEYFTSFRPEKPETQLVANLLKATIVHGHDGQPNVETNSLAYKVHDINTGGIHISCAIQLHS